MWSLFNMNNSTTRTMSELFKGVSTMTQSEDLFDCYPAVSAAFKYAKLFAMDLEDLDEDVLVEDSKGDGTQKIEKTEKKELEFEELKMFFWFLRQYFVLCQVLVYLSGYVAPISVSYWSTKQCQVFVYQALHYES